MNPMMKLTVAAALVGASASASAWSDSPQPFYGAPPALSEAQQAAISAEQKAFAEQQTKRMEQAIEFQRQLGEQIAVHQALFARQWQEPMAFDPIRSDPFAGIEPPAPPAMEMPSIESPFAPPLPEHVKKAMEQSNAYANKLMEDSNARFEKARKEMAAARDAHIKAMETRRQERLSRTTPLAARTPEASVL